MNHRFFWGVSTAAHQVEGNIANNWEDWRPRHRPDDPDLYDVGRATDHHGRYEEDLDIMRDLHLNAYRFSVEWARIEPEEGRFDLEALRHYREVVAASRKRGLEPMVTLWHYTLPVWLATKGGWGNRRSAEYFERFASRVAEALGNDVRYWFTLNEPEIAITHGYVIGDHPPGLRRWYLYPMLVSRLMRAHRLAYAAIKEKSPKAQVGMAKDAFVFEPAGGTINRGLKYLLDRFRNFYVFSHTRAQQDFIGINYYTRFVLDWRQLFKKEHPVLWDTGWEGAAQGLPVLLSDLQRLYSRPIIITENGTIDNEDSHRARYLTEMVAAVRKSRKAGIPLFGYLHWTLLDCFEWTAGYTLKFGLVGIDRRDGLKRTVKKSALAYRDLIDQG